MASSKLRAFSGELVELVASVLPGTVSLTHATTSGSAFVWDAAGHVVTNNHVVDGCGGSMVASSRGAKLGEAAVIGVDPLTDLAVLRLSAPAGSPLALRDEPARLGELCLALGSPLGSYPESVSLGIVSGVARSIPQATGRTIERVIQTDCAINPGNSGGPLIDVDGAVLGVNTCIDTRGASLGFAVPADTVRHVVPELIEHGAVERASLGVAVVVRDVDVDGHAASRMVVTKVSAPGSPLREGDVLLTIEGSVLDERADLYDQLDRTRIGKALAVEVLREGNHQTVELTPGALGTKPS